MQERGPIRIGLTGGIASGKSLVAEAFAALGVPVIDTDVLARDVVRPGSAALERVAAEFGADVIDTGGALDRARLRELVFGDARRRRRLEALLHPAIVAEMDRRAAESTAPYLLLVIPLLVETGFEGRVDRVLVVDCPEAVQLERLMARDGESAASAQCMLAAQVSRSERLAAADDVIDNSGTREAARANVAALHERYLRLASGAGLPNQDG
ncbi:MAG TPA: dephospho-CoA kinase [Gammaproteobacteria bacterium]|nr:dephospho-CoA kinase [Gammaproteobacteria bacterium]